MMIKASIIGATGYTGIELIRLLNRHKDVEIDSLFSNSYVGKNLVDLYPQFYGKKDYIFKEFTIDEVKNSDIVFTALPHGVSQGIVAKLYQHGIKVIDLSGDYRYHDTKIYEDWYGVKHEYAEIAREAVYGLVELNRELIKDASLIANPGCYPTATLLGLLPVVKAGLIANNEIIIDAKSGVSGAGKSVKIDTIFNEVDESIKAYSVNKHRHTSEIENILAAVINTKEGIKLSFTPHLIPMKRGMLITIYTKLSNEIKEEGLIQLYKEFYARDSFLQIYKSGNPQTKHVLGSNYCHIGLNIDRRTNRLIIVSVIDNLLKGASGQAVQNMNLMFGLPEERGLEDTAIFP